jgi:hypothetical protein
MEAHILKGSKQEIVDRLIRISGEVREAIVFEDEPAALAATPQEIEDIFAEMGPFMIDAPQVDDTREAVYTRMDGE